MRKVASLKEVQRAQIAVLHREGYSEPAINEKFTMQLYEFCEFRDVFRQKEVWASMSNDF